MKANWKFGEMYFEFEAATPKDLFVQIAAAQTTFQDTVCGSCGSGDIVYIDREAVSGKKTYQYLEISCQKCKAKLSFGQKEGGVIYPKRTKTDDDGKSVKDENGKTVYLEKGGWTKFVPNKAEDAR